MERYLYLELTQELESRTMSSYSKYIKEISELFKCIDFSFQMSRPVTRMIPLKDAMGKFNSIKLSDARASYLETYKKLVAEYESTLFPKGINHPVIYFRVENDNAEKLKEALKKIGTVNYVEDKYLNEAKKIFCMYREELETHECEELNETNKLISQEFTDYEDAEVVIFRDSSNKWTQGVPYINEEYDTVDKACTPVKYCPYCGKLL